MVQREALWLLLFLFSRDGARASKQHPPTITGSSKLLKTRALTHACWSHTSRAASGQVRCGDASRYPGAVLHRERRSLQNLLRADLGLVGLAVA